MLNNRENKSVTLLELMISLVVLSIIIMGFTSIELFSRYQLLTSDRRTTMLNESSRVIEHMTKQLVNAIGRVNDPAVVVYADGRGFRARIDNNPANGQIDATDSWIAYRHEPIGTTPNEEQIWFYPAAGNGNSPGGGSEVISSKIRRADAGAQFIYNSTLNFIEVVITACWDPAETLYPCGFSDNVSVTVHGKIKMPSVSTN